MEKLDWGKEQQVLKLVWSDRLAEKRYQLLKHEGFTNGGGFLEWDWRLHGYGNLEWAKKIAKHYSIDIPTKEEPNEYREE